MDQHKDHPVATSTAAIKAAAARLLQLDPGSAADQAAESIRSGLRKHSRRGAVVAMSGGVDSSVVAALCVHALGRENVLGLMLPERESSHDSLRLATMLTESLGLKSITEDITPVLAAAGCYERRDSAIRSVIPRYGSGWRAKIALPPLSDASSYRLFSVIAESPAGERVSARLTLEAYLGIVAATNFKQRTRKMTEYYYADSLNYADVGTPNRLEHELGFFVKGGDGLSDLQPIARFYKTQVYALAQYLGVPDEITSREPTTDTYPLAQSQEEFYFSVSHSMMDLCLYASNGGISLEDLARQIGMEPQDVRRVLDDIERKRRMSRYLRAAQLDA